MEEVVVALQADDSAIYPFSHPIHVSHKVGLMSKVYDVLISTTEVVQYTSDCYTQIY